MSALSDYAAKITTHLDKQDAELTPIASAVEGLTADNVFFRQKIEELQNNPGPITPADQAILDALEARVASQTAKLTDAKNRLQALDDLTPPTPPAG